MGALAILLFSAAPSSALGAVDEQAAASAPAPVQLTLSRNEGAVRHGVRIRLQGTLTTAGAPLAGRELTLNSGTTLVTKAVTNTRGVARFELKATATASYEARFTPRAGDVAAYQPGASKLLEVVVHPYLTVAADTALGARKKAVAITGERLTLVGTVGPFAAGEVVVRVLRGRRQVRRSSRRIVRRGGKGRFRYSFKPPGRGSYTIRATRIASSALGSARARVLRLLVVRASAHNGSKGAGVRVLQRRLSQLGYRTPVTGSFGASTARAVLAFRKVNGMGYLTSANRPVFRRLQRGGGAFRMRYPKAGKHIEFDWSRQVLVLARGARAVRVLHASSGTPSTPTIFGNFRFYSKTPGFNAKGMYYSSYFKGGYAIHGYQSVPTFPASHGCIRIPIPSATSVYGWIDLGDPISVYR